MVEEVDSYRTPWYFLSLGFYLEMEFCFAVLNLNGKVFPSKESNHMVQT